MHQGGWCIRTCRPLPSAPTLAQHARHAPARGRAPFLRGASRAVRTSVPLASFALAGGFPPPFEYLPLCLCWCATASCRPFANARDWCREILSVIFHEK